MAYTAAVVTVSDKGFRGERADASGPLLAQMLTAQGYQVVRQSIVPDEIPQIKEILLALARDGVHLVLTTGGTGFAQRDVTPEATLEVVERQAPGLAEMMRYESMRITPNACLSRAAAGIRGQTLIVNLPGSPKAAKENLQAILHPLEHGLKMLLTTGSADCAAPLQG